MGKQKLYLNGLEGKLKVSHGDLILLRNSPKNKEASGFVVKYTDRTVKLSHENPTKDVDWSSDGRTFLNFGKGNKTYNLKGFEDYEILREYKEEENSASDT